MADRWTLWQDEQFEVWTTSNPHLPPEEGFHVLVAPKEPPAHAWADPELTAAAFGLTAQVCQVLERLKMAPWFNLQANGNWGLFPGAIPHFHIHIYARRPGGQTWTQPVQLPRAPGTFGFAPLTEDERSVLAAALSETLG